MPIIFFKGEEKLFLETVNYKTQNVQKRSNLRKVKLARAKLFVGC